MTRTQKKMPKSPSVCLLLMVCLAAGAAAAGPSPLPFAGTLELSGINHELHQPRLQQLAKAAKRYFNDMGEATARSQWCGLRPCLPDGLPAVGPIAQHPNALIATGHAMAGLTLGPVTGQLIAEYVLDGNPAAAAEALRPDRF